MRERTDNAADRRANSKHMERLLFSKPESWLVLLILTLCVLGAVVFGALVKNHAEHRRFFGAIGEAAYRVASIPGEMQWSLGRLLGTGFESRYLATESNLDGSGFTFPAGRFPGAHGYLLLSRYDIDTDRALVELVDLDREKTVHSWQLDLEAIAARAGGGRHGAEAIAVPYPWPDGSLSVMARNTVAMLDRCSNIKWVIGAPYMHHSVEADADGHLWVPYEMALARISRTGEILSLIDFEQVLRRNGYRSLLYMMDSILDDPLHLNDIQPVRRDGPYWRRGDLFISLRTHSVVLLYRPSTDSIVWLRTGPWLHQHDVNIVSDTEISVFSNNAVFAEDTYELGHRVLGASEVFIHDFETGETRSPWREAFRQHDVKTETQGRATVIGEDAVFVEESDYGRAVSLSADGDLYWTYVNRGSDGEIYQLSWSRYLTEAEGKPIARALRENPCL